AAAANLRKALHYARRNGDEQLIESVGELLSLPAERVRVDVDEFRALTDRARRTGDPETYWAAVGLFGEGLLPCDRAEEGAIGPQNELRHDFRSLVEELAALLESRGEIGEAVRAVGLLVAAEPGLEEGHLRLMRLHALAGRRGEALRQYEQIADPGPEAQR